MMETRVLKYDVIAGKNGSDEGNVIIHRVHKKLPLSHKEKFTEWGSKH